MMNAEHPIWSSVTNKVTVFACGLLFAVVQALLLIRFAGYDWSQAVTDALLSVVILAVTGFAMWYVIDFVRFPFSLAVLAFSVQAVMVGSAYMLNYFFSDEDTNIFIDTIPFRLLYGLLCWIILSMWYDKQRFVRRILEADESVEVSSPSPQENIIDRISVKNGTRIDLIQLNEIYYIQACGDYVSFFTTSGEYLKEQTMKYFEKHLPSKLFIRIHRSYIVNVEQIMRIELFGKENYQVRLKNGSSLRASLNGYKLLKKQLML